MIRRGPHPGGTAPGESRGPGCGPPNTLQHVRGLPSVGPDLIFEGVCRVRLPPMLPLTLRPTDIGTPPAFQHLKDYCVYEDKREGRPYLSGARGAQPRADVVLVNHGADPEARQPMGTPRPLRPRRRSSSITGGRHGNERRHDRSRQMGRPSSPARSRFETARGSRRLAETLGRFIGTMPERDQGREAWISETDAREPRAFTAAWRDRMIELG